MTTYSDTFTRANGALGTGWAADPDTSFKPLVIVSNDATYTSGEGFAISYRTDTFTADQYIEVVSNTVTGGAGGDYYLRCSGNMTSGLTCYIVYWYTTGSQVTIGLGRTVAGVFTSLITEINVSPGASDITIRGEVEGSAQRLYYNGALQNTAADTTVTTGTAQALDIYTAGVIVRSVAGGDITAPGGVGKPAVRRRPVLEYR